MGIARTYEVSCDSHNHEVDSVPLKIDARNLDAARGILRALEWEVMSDGRTHCPECIKPAAP
jgi:hypothetical protein